MEGNSIDKLILDENDLIRLGITHDYLRLRRVLYKSNERDDCILVQSAAFVSRGKAFLIMGVGGIDFLDALGRNRDVDGIIGNGNALFVSKDFRNTYSAHTSQELIECFELDGPGTKFKFLENAPIGPLIFLLRSFQTVDEYEEAKKKVNKIVFQSSSTFAGEPTRFAGSLKSRLRGKFVATARVVHCARRPNLMRKECLFESRENVYQAINRFHGSFELVYTLWSQELCDAIGMRTTRLVPEFQTAMGSVAEFLVKTALESLG